MMPKLSIYFLHKVICGVALIPVSHIIFSLTALNNLSDLTTPLISESMGTGVIRVTGEADFEDVTDQAVSRPSEDFNRANSKNQALVEADVNVKVKVGDKEPIALPFESEVRFYETAREERGAPNEVVDIEFGGKFNFTEGGHRDKMSFGATAIVKFWEISYT